jgi:hypothetical protein
MTNAFPNPNVERLSITALFPYNLEGQGKMPLRAFQEKMIEQKLELPDGWEERLPEELSAYRLDRWFFREVRNLLFDDQSAGSWDSRKFRWVRHPKYQDKLNIQNDTSLSIAIVNVNDLIRGKNPAKLKVKVLGPVKKLELFALFGEIGTGIVGVRWRQEKISLQTALEAVHFSSLSEGSVSVVAFIPNSNSKFSEIRKAENEERLKRYEIQKGTDSNHNHATSIGSLSAENSENLEAREPIDENQKDTSLSFTATLENLKDCLVLPPIMDGVQIPSIVDRIWDDLSSPFKLPGKDLATKGRVPLAVNIDLKERGTLHYNQDDQEWRQIEWLCSRFLRHPGALGPDKKWVYPLQGGVDADPAVVSIRPTGTRGIHLSSEGLMSVGCLATDFDNDWHVRLANEYFFAYLIALHQSIVLQNISWRSFSRTSGSKDAQEDHDNLFEMFKAFDTAYNFSRVSNHVTMQSVYEAARKTLGVHETTEEVRSELRNWIESEQREEQRNLNALAVIAILVSAATYFISLNLETFTRDSNIRSMSIKAAFWLGVPTLLVILVTIINKTMKNHLDRALSYILGRSWRKKFGIWFAKLFSQTLKRSPRWLVQWFEKLKTKQSKTQQEGK